MKIEKHFLLNDDDEQIPYKESPNHSGSIKPKFLIIHYTAGSNAESSIEWLTSKKGQASAHLVIGKDGSITQLVPFNYMAWHAGPSSWEFYKGMNNYSIGIELDNAGMLKLYKDGWRTRFQKKPEKDYILAKHKFGDTEYGWQIFPEKQLDVLTEVAIALVNEYQLIDILGHEDISPRRKWDPGPAFPMHNFRSQVMGRKEIFPVAYTTTSTLNIRSGPGTQHGTITKKPLKQDCNMEYLQKEGSWIKVHVLDEVDGDMDVEGWVHSNYCKQLLPSEIKAKNLFDKDKKI
ncbi:MAG: N-acetylmuramoyl-L-alanine amidase [Anaerolineales bacterium]|nr:N-acetylmuramoyl-L-alanine amidase [Anaerolineales bacterium]